MATYPCRVRKHRKSTRLFQSEVALLLGLRSQASVSQIEEGHISPAMQTALAYAILFDAPMDELFPRLHAGVHKTMLANARRLHARLTRTGARPETAARLAALITRLNAANRDA